MPLPAIDPRLYAEQLTAKAERLRAEFAEFEPPPLELFESPPLHYRMRAEFRLWHQDGDCFYAMFDPAAPKEPVAVRSYPQGSERINELMPALLDRVREEPVLKRRLFQVEFLTTLSGEALVTLIYHKPLDDAWLSAAHELRSALGADIIGRSKKQKLVVERDYVEEVLHTDGRNYRYMQVENSFSQPNAAVNQQMIDWACRQRRNVNGDTLELYCGNGNFTLPLARHSGAVLATEVSKASVRAAEYNIAANDCDNIAVARLSSAEFAQAWRRERPFRRLAHVDLDGYDFQSLLVDPPRAGLDPATLLLAQALPQIIYISCNPQTLRDNLRQLRASHCVTGFALFDQFPYTSHIECGVQLRRR